ncbi:MULTISPECIES: hypothetical protein [Streptomyces]|nr:MULTISPECIES: hypothetical protein [Streptomyces]
MTETVAPGRLFAEEYDGTQRRLRGNLPQAHALFPEPTVKPAEHGG